MFKRFFGGEKGQGQPGITSPEDEDINIAGEMVNKDANHLERLGKMAMPLFEGSVDRVEKMGFRMDDNIEIEMGGKKQEGVLKYIVPNHTEENPQVPHAITLSIKLKESGEYADIDLEDVLSGKVKIKKIE